MARAWVIGMAVLFVSACRPGSSGAGASVTPAIPRDASRFEIEAVDDSTARFRPREARWIRVGMSVHAVDPMKRDAIVARLRVLSADSATVTALVTSQVTRVTTAHVLLVARDAAPWWRARPFWWGAAAGGVLGAAASGLAR